MNDMKNTNYYNYVILGIYYYYQIFPGSYLPFIDPRIITLWVLSKIVIH
jgi:hypothetical protein